MSSAPFLFHLMPTDTTQRMKVVIKILRGLGQHKLSSSPGFVAAGVQQSAAAVGISEHQGACSHTRCAAGCSERASYQLASGDVNTKQVRTVELYEPADHTRYDLIKYRLPFLLFRTWNHTSVTEFRHVRQPEENMLIVQVVRFFLWRRQKVFLRAPESGMMTHIMVAINGFLKSLHDSI